MMNNYGTPPLALVRGSGAEVWDEDGRRYLDLLGGIAVNALGHAHPAVVEAVTKQIATLGHTSNLYITEPPLALAERLLELLGTPGRVLFCNSGAEANEAAFKMARRTGRAKDHRGGGGVPRPDDGRARAHRPAEQENAVRAARARGVARALRRRRRAVARRSTPTPPRSSSNRSWGRAGAVTPPAGYLAAAREITAERGALLVLDEVQTGIGRTGAWFAHQNVGVVPDVITLAKGLGGGLPIGACIGLGARGTCSNPGTTAPRSAATRSVRAAALAVLDTIAADGLLEHTALVGKGIATAVEELRHPLVRGVDGAGLLIGILLTRPVSAAVAAQARAAGFLVNNAVPDRVRLAPPLVLTDEQAEEFLIALPGILDASR